MGYILESDVEFERLEKQSRQDLYDFKKELDVVLPLFDGARVLDAGCGSGIVSRYLATAFPRCAIVGCDGSKDRVAQAVSAAKSLDNCTFKTSDLTSLDFDDESFDLVVCRFVLEHLSPIDCMVAMTGLVRCLKPGGRICLIDIDGMFYNFYPKFRLLEEFLEILDSKKIVDLNIGRKLPSLLITSGCYEVYRTIESMNFFSEKLDSEIELLKERFNQTHSSIVDLYGSEVKAKQFQKEFIEKLRNQGSVLFYNKFIVVGKKPLKLSVLNDRKK